MKRIVLVVSALMVAGNIDAVDAVKATKSGRCARVKGDQYNPFLNPDLLKDSPEEGQPEGVGQNEAVSPCAGGCEGEVDPQFLGEEVPRETAGASEPRIDSYVRAKGAKSLKPYLIGAVVMCGTGIGALVWKKRSVGPKKHEEESEESLEELLEEDQIGEEWFRCWTI